MKFFEICADVLVPKFVYPDRKVGNQYSPNLSLCGTEEKCLLGRNMESLQRRSSYHSQIFCLLKGYIWKIWIRQQLTAISHTHPIPGLAGRTWSAFLRRPPPSVLNTLALYSGIEIDYYNLELRISQLVIAIWKSMYLFVWKPNNYFPARDFHWYLLIN